MTDQEKILQLIREVAEKEERTIPPGATEEQVAAFEARTQVRVPPELRELLSWSIAPPVGSARLSSIDPDYGIWRVEDSFLSHPVWRQRGWVSLAWDGAGSQYVLDTSTTIQSALDRRPGETQSAQAGGIHPVYFMDHEYDDDTPAYVVASGLWRFLRFFLLRQAGRHKWPFDRESVLRDDPLLARYRGPVPLPWDA